MTSEPKFFEARDGVRLAWREMGEGAPIILLHGLFSSAEVNWIKFGTAARVAAEGGGGDWRPEATLREGASPLRQHFALPPPHKWGGLNDRSPPQRVVRDKLR